jgi:hypothetical protein
MEAICSSKMLVGFQQNTLRYIPKDRTLHNHCYWNVWQTQGCQANQLGKVQMKLVYIK